MRALTLAAALAAFLAGPALADRHPCGPRSEIVAQLEGSHQERRVFRGPVSTGRMLELFMSPKGGWTIVLTQPELPGWACVIGGGTGGHATPMQKLGWRI